MNKIRTFLVFLVGLIAGFMPAKASTVSGPPPTNNATVYFENFFLVVGRNLAIGALRFKIACAKATNGLFDIPLVMALVGDEKKSADEQLLESLAGISKRVEKIDSIESKLTKSATDYEQVTKLLADVQKDMIDVRKQQIAIRATAPRRKGEVSDDCAKYLGALFIRAGIEQGKLVDSEGGAPTKWKNMVDAVIGKTAVTSSDIPLPIQYSGDVVELVGQYGAARQYGTVFPLGTATVKLPKLTTDPTFALIAGSGAVPEKVPVVGWATFTPEKFGGIVRLPSEIDEDSIIPIGQFIARYAARQLAYLEDYQVFRSTGAGSGVNGTAEGLTKSVVTDSKTVALASTKTAISDATLAKFRELRTKPDAAALRMGAYYLHPSLEQMLAGFNTAGDKPYQANGLNGATLDGFPIRWVDVMPVYSTSAQVSTVFALFGDLSFAYLGVRGSVRFDVSRDVYFATDEIGIRALERMTTAKMAAGAIAGLITAAS